MEEGVDAADPRDWKGWRFCSGVQFGPARGAPVLNMSCTGGVHDPGTALEMAFVNKCEDAERAVVAEYFQRCFDREFA